MPMPIASQTRDNALEEHAMRKAGLLGRGGGMGNALYAIDYHSLPREARTTIDLIITNGPFPFPGKDGTTFGNRFGDLPGSNYLEYTVPTPGATNRGKRRIVAKLKTAQLFFTACHYERIHVAGGTHTQKTQARLDATIQVDPEWRNGFYVITGLEPELRGKIYTAIKLIS